MKKAISVVLALLIAAVAFASCGKGEELVLNEKSFFLAMTNIQYYPEKYVGKNIELDCFTYELTAVDGTTYTCGVRKCSSGYGCNCGKDTVIGFILDYDGEIPEPKNQSEDTNEKTWVHISGKLNGANTRGVEIYVYDGDQIDYTKTETINFLTFEVESLQLITDYGNLNYYVTK